MKNEPLLIELSETDGAILFRNDGMEVHTPSGEPSTEVLYMMAVAFMFLQISPIEDERLNLARELVDEVLNSIRGPRAGYMQ